MELRGLEAGAGAGLDLVRQGKFDPEPMTVQKVSWDDAAEALSDLRAKAVVERTA